MMKSTGLKLAAIGAFAFGLGVAMSANANDPGCWTRCWQETLQCLQTLPANQHSLCYDHYNACTQYGCGGMEP